MKKKEIIQKLGERKKMFNDYLELVRQTPRSTASKNRPCGANTTRNS
jgi:hypothetical protein